MCLPATGSARTLAMADVLTFTGFMRWRNRASDGDKWVAEFFPETRMELRAYQPFILRNSADPNGKIVAENGLTHDLTANPGDTVTLYMKGESTFIDGAQHIDLWPIPPP